MSLLDLPPGIVEIVIKRLETLATYAAERGDPPFAAILYASDGNMSNGSFECISESTATVHTEHNHLAHAEMRLLLAEHRKLYDARHQPDRSQNLTFHLFVNAEPCTMCTAAIFKSQIDDLYCFPTASKKDMIPSITAKEVVDRSNEAIDQLGITWGKVRMHYIPFESAQETN
jgi:tRNA(Arg) A34 adenosine deaminase TadA